MEDQNSRILRRVCNLFTQNSFTQKTFPTEKFIHVEATYGK